MAGLDQPAQVSIALRIRFVIMPAGHVQRADARRAPARGEIIQVHARAIRAVEKRP